MVRWKSVALRMGSDLRDAVGPILTDDQAQETASMGQLADGPTLRSGDPAGDEFGDLAVLVDDSESCVLGSHQIAHSIDDELQHILDLQHAADSSHGLVEC